MLRIVKLSFLPGHRRPDPNSLTRLDRRGAPSFSFFGSTYLLARR